MDELNDYLAAYATEDDDKVVETRTDGWHEGDPEEQPPQDPDFVPESFIDEDGEEDDIADSE